MKVWQRAVTLQKRQPGNGGGFRRPRGPFDGLFQFPSAPPMGKYEVNTNDLESLNRLVLQACPTVFSVMNYRRRLLSQGDFQFQRLSSGTSGVPGDFFGTQALSVLEVPWLGGTTGQLISKMLFHADLMGNSYVTQQDSGYLKVLRPDWITTMYGSKLTPELAGDAIDGELLGYIYWPRNSGAYLDWEDREELDRALEDGRIVFLRPDQVAHFAPIPDPVGHRRGMSWIAPLINEIDADLAGTIHKAAYFRNGMTPKLAIKFDASVEEDEFRKARALIEEKHAGPWNAYSTIYLAGGADAIPISQNLKDVDFSKITEAGETRIASAAGIPPALVGFMAGLQGSSLNAGNIQQLKREVGESVLIPLWKELAACLSTIVPPPPGSRLAVDTRDVAYLRDDALAAAQVLQIKVATIGSALASGFTPDSAIPAIMAGDPSLMKHSGLYSVQLQVLPDPKATAPPPAVNAPAGGNPAAALPGKPDPAAIEAPKPDTTAKKPPQEGSA